MTLSRFVTRRGGPAAGRPDRPRPDRPRPDRPGPDRPGLAAGPGVAGGYRALAIAAAAFAVLILVLILWPALTAGTTMERLRLAAGIGRDRVEVALPPYPVPPAGPDGATTGLPPWRAHAHPFDQNDARPRVALIVADLGLSEPVTRTAIRQMPGTVTLAFAAQGTDLAGWLDQARADGHEILLTLPMEPAGYPQNDPGPNSLLTTLSTDENRRRLDLLLGGVTGFVGVLDSRGARFTNAPDAVRPVLAALNARGLMFVDSGSSAHSTAPRLATEIGLPRAIGDRFIGGGASGETIDLELAQLETLALGHGAAVGIVLPDPLTFERLARWLPTLPARGLVLAPITAVANRQPNR